MGDFRTSSIATVGPKRPCVRLDPPAGVSLPEVYPFSFGNASPPVHLPAMIKGSEKRKAEYSIENYILDRWSPRAMNGESLSTAELCRLFEAARWAPSSYNAQPWRALYALRETAPWETFFGLLVEGNQAWAKDAAALVVFLSAKNFEHNGKPNTTHSYDCGSAWENFALQGFSQGLVVHGMVGFDAERARTELQVPDEFSVEAMAAVGRPGEMESLSEKMQKAESPNERRPVSESIREGNFSF